VNLSPIAILRTPFPEKFGIPRQSGIVESAIGKVEMLPEFNRIDFVRGLESFSHVWLITVFDKSAEWDGNATVRPPRLGGNERLGVFATRSPNRPNPIGLSLVRLLKIETQPRLVLHVGGIDAVDGTPVLDIKPYLPWCESRPEATADWAGGAPTQKPIECIVFPEELRRAMGEEYSGMVTDLLRLEVQPAYHTATDRTYGMTVGNWNIKWRLENEQVIVTEVTHQD
jgi:tRNA (adenine37-N6)-methyltransferase